MKEIIDSASNRANSCKVPMDWEILLRNFSKSDGHEGSGPKSPQLQLEKEKRKNKIIASVNLHLAKVKGAVL